MRYHNFVVVLLVALMTAWSAVSYAQSDLAAETRSKGVGNIDFGVSFNSNYGDDDNDFTAFGRISGGYFFADQWELSVSASAFGKSSDVADSGGGYLDARLAYHFINDSDWIPYVGVLGGIWVIFEPSYEYARVGGFFGVDRLVSEHTSIFVEYNAAWTKDPLDRDILQQFFLIGVKFFF